MSLEPADLLDRARRFREKATECRLVASATGDPFVRKTYEAVAKSYDMLAMDDEQAYQARKAKPSN